jgi:hypothetical protein
MTELYINNQLVELGDSTNIKLLDENPYFTKSSKYTYDVEVPLKGSMNNIKIFGNLHRQDVEKQIITYKARMVSDNHNVIDGTATLTSVTDTGIKLQILAGNAEMNFLSKYEKVYVDEMKLGFSAIEYRNSTDFWEIAAFYEQGLTNWKNYIFLTGKYGVTDYIFMPVKGTDSDSVYNNLCIYDCIGSEKGEYRVELLVSNWLRSNRTVPAWLQNIAPQPYMCFIIRKILDVMGYTVTRNDIESTVLANEFIANNKSISDWAEVLPHWTVSEFMTQIERHFGVVFRLNDTTKTAEIINRDSYYKENNNVYLDNIEDEYSVSSDTDETKDITDSNIKYTFNSVDKYMQIDEDLLKEFNKVTKSTYDELSTYYNSLSDDDKGKHLYEADGIQYYDNLTNKIHSLVECNQYRRLIRNSDSDSSDIEIKIVPCSMERGKGYYQYNSYTGKSTSFDVVYLAPTTAAYSKIGTLQEEIENITSKNSNDTLEVALNDGALQPIKCDSVPEKDRLFPWPFVLTNDLVNGEVHRGFSYELNKISSRPNMYSLVYGKLNNINTKSEIVYKIISDKMFDPMKRYVINNKPYICEKIEYKITDKGIDKEKTGYFYEA